jgi:hypothetical protein
MYMRFNLIARLIAPFVFLGFLQPVHAEDTPLVYPLDGIKEAKFTGGLTLLVKCGAVDELMIDTENEKAFSYKNKGDEIVVKQKQLKKWLTLGQSDVPVKATLTVSGDVPDLDLSTGVSATVIPCDRSQSIFKVELSTGAAMTLARGDFETLEVEANTGASAEVDQSTTANQLYLDLETGSTFFGGQQLQVETARVELSTGSTANVCGAKTVTGKVSQQLLNYQPHLLTSWVCPIELETRLSASNKRVVGVPGCLRGISHEPIKPPERRRRFVDFKVVPQGLASI